MIAHHFEFLVEEPSMEAFLRALLPRWLPPNCTFDVHPFNGKPDLLRKLPQRLKGYRNLLSSNSRIVVVVDLDDEDCKGLKNKLEQMARQANLQTRTSLQGGAWQVVNRIAIEELEAWYFGDWEAVRAVYPNTPASIPQKRRFRNPDTVQGTWEAFAKVLQQHGYYRGGLLKIEAARKIGPHIDPTRSRSHSFQVFWNAVLEAVQGTACVE